MATSKLPEITTKNNTKCFQNMYKSKFFDKKYTSGNTGFSLSYEENCSSQAESPFISYSYTTIESYDFVRISIDAL